VKKQAGGGKKGAEISDDLWNLFKFAVVYQL
jgi:hypothetical protein